MPFSGDEFRDKEEARLAKLAEDAKEHNATPAAEAEAVEHGVDLSEVEGSGKDERILKADVEAVESD